MAINWQQIAQDFEQKYKGTFVRVKFDNRPNLTIFYIKGIKRVSSGAPELHLINPEDGLVVLKYDTDSEIYFDYPEVGYFFHQDTAFLAYRRHDRRWVRGLCASTIYVVSPYTQYTFKVQAEIQHYMIESMFRPLEQYTLKEASHILSQEHCISIPLNKEFALGQDVRPTKNIYLLWYHAQPVAEYTTGRALIIKNQVFRQEILDFIKTTGELVYAH